MKTAVVLLLLILLNVSGLQAQDKSAERVRPTNETIGLAPGQGRPFYVITADDMKMQIQDVAFFRDSLSLTGAINQIDPKWIQSISVLKGKSATDTYGARGQDGVILIELKKGALNSLPKEFVEKFKKG